MKLTRKCWNCKHCYKCENKKSDNGVCKDHKFFTRIKLNNK